MRRDGVTSTSGRRHVPALQLFSAGCVIHYREKILFSMLRIICNIWLLKNIVLVFIFVQRNDTDQEIQSENAQKEVTGRAG